MQRTTLLTWSLDILHRAGLKLNQVFKMQGGGLYKIDPVSGSFLRQDKDTRPLKVRKAQRRAIREARQTAEPEVIAMSATA